MHQATSVAPVLAADCRARADECANCDALLDIPGAHVLDVDTSGAAMVITVETEAGHLGCPTCGVIGVGHGRDEVALVDAPWAGRPVRLVWRKRRGLCRERRCSQLTFAEDRPEIAATRAAAVWTPLSTRDHAKGGRTIKLPSRRTDSHQRRQRNHHFGSWRAAT